MRRSVTLNIAACVCHLIVEVDEDGGDRLKHRHRRHRVAILAVPQVEGTGIGTRICQIIPQHLQFR